MSSAPTQKDKLWSDVGLMAVSIFFAVKLAESGVVTRFISGNEGFEILESFIAGMFFTSAFTTAPAIVALGTIAAKGSPLLTALFGGLGAMCVDLIIFRFVKRGVREDVLALAGKERRAQIRHIFEKKLFRWITPLVAAFILASPFPDELAVVIMGFTGAKTKFFAPFSFISNFAGIFIIGLVARAMGA